MMFSWAIVALASSATAAVLNPRQPASPVSPDFFQTTPERKANKLGPTVTAKEAPFLAQTNPVPNSESSYVPNSPLATDLPISGNTNKSSIFQLVGQLSSYFPNPIGFGVNEYSLPPGANISQVHVLHRHGARYPTGTSSVAKFGSLIYNITHNATAKWSGDLTFLNDWSYTLGSEILVARGRQELFDSGVLHYYNYGQLYKPGSKILARTTSQDRMLKSAEYFMAGFFGLEWTNNASLVIIWEQLGFNNSLAGYYKCNNSEDYHSTGGNNASLIWEGIYLKDATERFKSMAGGYNWTTADTYNAQTICPYETVAYGYSEWCDLFTYEEWLGFEYSIDLQFNGNDGFASPTGRGVGIGFVEEIYARLQGHVYNLPAGSTNVNTTLDEMTGTFPLGQNIYFDFSHDTNIMSIMTAFGLKQFAQPLPATGPPANQQLIVSHLTPFGARFVIETISAPHPVLPKRPSPSASASYYNTSGPATTYVHILLNQRTLPLYLSYPECETRDDGWCELNAFVGVVEGLLQEAQYEFSCFGSYPAPAYGSVTNGVPPAGAAKRDGKMKYKRMLGGGMGTGLEMKRDSGM